jgi:hypothetical protein
MERKRRKKKTDAERLRNAEDRNNILKCPFCAEIPTVPVEIDTPFGGTVDGGNCRLLRCPGAGVRVELRLRVLSCRGLLQRGRCQV